MTRSSLSSRTVSQRYDIHVAAQEAGPSHDEVSTVHTLLQRAFETQQAENSYWHEQIMGGYQSRSYQTVRIMQPSLALHRVGFAL